MLEFHQHLGAALPRGARVLDGRRGGFLRADSVENTSSGLLDVLQALRQQLGVTLVKLDVILRRGARLEADCFANYKGDRFGLGLADALRCFPARLGLMKNDHVLMLCST